MTWPGSGARSNSHSVAARGSDTTVPLASGEGSGRLHRGPVRDRGLIWALPRRFLSQLPTLQQSPLSSHCFVVLLRWPNRMGRLDATIAAASVSAAGAGRQLLVAGS